MLSIGKTYHPKSAPVFPLEKSRKKNWLKILYPFSLINFLIVVKRILGQIDGCFGLICFYAFRVRSSCGCSLRSFHQYGTRLYWACRKPATWLIIFGSPLIYLIACCYWTNCILYRRCLSLFKGCVSVEKNYNTVMMVWNYTGGFKYWKRSEQIAVLIFLAVAMQWQSTGKLQEGNSWNLRNHTFLRHGHIFRKCIVPFYTKEYFFCSPRHSFSLTASCCTSFGSIFAASLYFPVIQPPYQCLWLESAQYPVAVTAVWLEEDKKKQIRSHLGGQGEI